MKKLLFLLALALPALPLAAAEDFLMGSVVKSDKWKMDRKNNREFFDGAVSFKNPSYTMRSDHAVYNHSARLWDIYGSSYILRKFQDNSKLEVNCEKGKYFETEQSALFERGDSQIVMKYYFPPQAAGAKGAAQNSGGQPGVSASPAPPTEDFVELYGRADKAKAENLLRRISFEGDFSLTTENLYMISSQGLYHDLDKSFLMYDSTPAAVGTREGYDFAVNAETIKFFRDSRDIKFHNNVSGWVKDMPSKVVE